MPAVNAWSAVIRFLRVKKYDPATFGAPRVFLVRFDPAKPPSEIRVCVPVPKFEVRCRGSYQRGWSKVLTELPPKRLIEIAKERGWELPAEETGR